MNKQSIQITIADRNFPLLIPAEDEEKVRAAVKVINEQVSVLIKAYKTRDTQDALSMALLQFVIRLLDAEKNIEKNLIIEELKTLDTLLNDYIKLNLV